MLAPVFIDAKIARNTRHCQEIKVRRYLVGEEALPFLPFPLSPFPPFSLSPFLPFSLSPFLPFPLSPFPL